MPVSYDQAPGPAGPFAAAAGLAGLRLTAERVERAAEDGGAAVPGTVCLGASQKVMPLVLRPFA
jgi:hypothetical protein